MSLALAIASIVSLDVALLALLAFVMAQPRRLRPHVGHVTRPRELQPRPEHMRVEPLELAA
jgi:hypothetical protein